MKHAILILAHKNIGQLCRLAGYFEKDCDVFIHIDKKQPVTREEEEKLRSYKQVKAVSREYDVNWGGTSVLESEMHLLRMAVQRSDADYFHLISGQDYPTRPLDYFLEFFDRNAGKEYIGYLHLPHPNWGRQYFPPTAILLSIRLCRRQKESAWVGQGTGKATTGQKGKTPHSR